MRLDTFIAARSPDWRELELLLREAGRRPERLGPDRLLRLGALYRASAADLARLRRAAPRSPETARLEVLVGGARQAVYDARTGRRSVVRFFVTGYWRLIVERKKALLVAFVLLFGSAALAALWGIHDPAAATGVVPQQFRPALQPGHPWHDMSPSQQTAFTTEVFTHNIQVTFLAFALGIPGCIGTDCVLIYNGVELGVVGGLASASRGKASCSSSSSSTTAFSSCRASRSPPRPVCVRLARGSRRAGGRAGAARPQEEGVARPSRSCLGPCHGSSWRGCSRGSAPTRPGPASAVGDRVRPRARRRSTGRSSLGRGRPRSYRAGERSFARRYPLTRPPGSAAAPPRPRRARRAQLRRGALAGAEHLDRHGGPEYAIGRPGLGAHRAESGIGEGAQAHDDRVAARQHRAPPRERAAPRPRRAGR